MTVNPYAEALGERDAAAVIAETPRRLKEVLEGLSSEEIEARPAPGKWNVREVVAHLADCEIAFGFRMRQSYGGERLVQPFDQDAWARVYTAYTTELALATFVALRAWNVAFVGGLTEADKLLPAVHPQRGEMRLWTIVETMAGHDLHHLEKLKKR
ncbi:MAG: DinB family protein [Acidobacteriaceae bacterium]